MRVGISTLGVIPRQVGGVETGVRNLIAALATWDNENEYTLFVSEENRLLFERLAREDFRVRLVPAVAPMPVTNRWVRRAIRWLKAWPTVEQLVTYAFESAGVEVVHFPNTTIRCSGLSAPIVLTFWDAQQHYYPEFFSEEELRIRRETYQASLEEARRIIVASEFTRQSVQEAFGVPAEKVRVVPMSAEPGFAPVPKEEVEAVRRFYGLPEDFLFYPAYTWPHKNHVRLLQALALLKQRHGQVPALVLSSAVPSFPGEEVRSAVLEQGLDDSVRFLSLRREHLPAVYSAALALVFPSLFEGFGYPVVEAMACGCPVVSSQATSLPELVGEAGLLFDPLDVEAMAAAIERVLLDRDFREELARKGLERAKHFSLERVAQETVKVYREACR